MLRLPVSLVNRVVGGHLLPPGNVDVSGAGGGGGGGSSSEEGSEWQQQYLFLPVRLLSQLCIAGPAARSTLPWLYLY